MSLNRIFNTIQTVSTYKSVGRILNVNESTVSNTCRCDHKTCCNLLENMDIVGAVPVCLESLNFSLGNHYRIDRANVTHPA